MNILKKKGIILFVCFVLILMLGWNLYAIRYKQAQFILKYTQNSLIQLAGNKGHYTYFKARILKVSQTILIENIDLSLSDGSDFKIKELRLIPARGRKIAKVVAKDIEWKKDGYQIFTKKIFLYDFLFSKKIKKPNGFMDDFYDISFQKVFLKKININSALGTININNWQIEHTDKQENLYVHQLDHLDYFFRDSDPLKNLMHHVYVNSFVMQIKDEQPQISLGFLLTFTKQKNVQYNLSGLTEYNADHHAQFSVSQAQLETWAEQSGVIDGKGNLIGVKYDLLEKSSGLGKFLKKLGYHSLTGDIQYSFSYDPEQSLLMFKPIHYSGNNFVNVDCFCQLSMDMEPLFMGLPGMFEKVKFKSGMFYFVDAGLKERFLEERSKKFNLSQSETERKILYNLESSQQGKDFSLDYQFYHSLAHIIQDPQQQIKVSVDFSKGETLYKLFGSDFLDFFKLVNQGNMQIMSVKKH